MFSLQSIVYLVIAVILSMSIHETAHGLVSYWMGDTTAKLEGRLSLRRKNRDYLDKFCGTCRKFSFKLYLYIPILCTL